MQVWEKHLFLSFPLLADRSRLGGERSLGRPRSFVLSSHMVFGHVKSWCASRRSGWTGSLGRTRQMARSAADGGRETSRVVGRFKPNDTAAPKSGASTR